MKRTLSGYIPTLDGWRSLAILGVMINHGVDSFQRFAGLDSPGLKAAASFGSLGVDVFFGISGFLICSRLIEEFQRRGSISLKGFYIRRAFRILPPYFLCLAGIAVLAAMGLVHVTRWEWLGTLFFFLNYVPAGQSGWFTGHFWSLAVEEHFYLIWPVALAWWGLARARRYILIPTLLVALWRIAEFRLHLGERLIPGLGFFTRTDIRFDALLWGCWAALLFAEIRDRVGPWLRGGVWIGLALAFALCAVFLPPMALLWQSAIIPLLLLGTILHPQEWAGRILEAAPLQWIGKLSYSLYLWQQIFLVDAAQSRSLSILQDWPVNVLATVACAAASFYLVEKPAIRVGHRLAKPINQERDAAPEFQTAAPAEGR